MGNMASVSVGAVVAVTGTWTHNAKYGRQFSVSTWEESIPATVYGIEKYLGSGLIKGIGPKFAKEIVKLFGENTIEVIEKEPHRLIEVPKIGKKRVDMITKAMEQTREVKNIMVFLQEHNVSTAFGYRIFKVYGDRSISVIKENPYKLADDVWGIGFKTADQIASKLGMEKESFDRLRAGMFYTLNQFAEDGHCYATRTELSEKSAEILEIEQGKIASTIETLITNRDLILAMPDNIYLPPFYYSEVGVARRIKEILTAMNQNAISDFDKAIAELQDKSAIQYDDVQIQAIKLATSSKFCVITGGPGTGKTTTTKAIIDLFKLSGRKILLAAPTGRAAKRMSEATGKESKTIHRLLESKPPEGFGKNADNPLDGDILVLDECSMVDVLLMYNTLKAVPNTMTVILVGDIDQLPAVGAGNILGDIIESGAVPVVRLTRIFRQAMGSKIITNAHKINNGNIPDLSGGKNSDFFFISIEDGDKERVVNEIVSLCSERLPTYYKVNPISDIQVLTPMRRGDSGADNLNKLLQATLNKDNKICLRRGATEYRTGDKVMQVKNNYDKDIFNGDIGVISSVNIEDKSLVVNFDGRQVEYDILELDELVLSYAITVHRSQGGEFPIVVIPFTMSHFIMLQRNLLYTGVTRAKRVVVIVGEKRAVAYAVKNAISGKRNTMLAEQLR